MRIEFDTNNAREVMAVRAAIDSLAGRSVALEVPLSVATPTPDLPEAETVEAPLSPPTAGAAADTAADPAISTAPPTLAPAVAPSTGADVDSQGLPWDARIHSSNRQKIADGTWRKKRGVSDTLVETVSAELRQIMAAPQRHDAGDGVTGPIVHPEPMFSDDDVAPGEPSAPPVDASTAFVAPAAGAASSPPPPPPVAPPAPPVAAAVPPPAPPVAPPAEAAGVTDFASLMRKVTAMQSAGTLTVAATQEIAGSLGLNGLRDLIHRPDLVASFDQLLPTGA
jgi:hypothetical protein